jgi:serine/threonine-protein kinase RsbW
MSVAAHMQKPVKNDVLKLSMPGELTYLPLARLFVQETGRIFGFENDDLQRIALAVEEAVVNVMEHAFAGDEASSFDMVCERLPLGMRITIREKGLPFDPSLTPKFKPEENLDSFALSGIGLLLMRESMDEVSFHNLGMEGKETRLVKYFPATHIEAHIDPAETEEKTDRSANERIIQKIDYSVRRMEPAEAIEISRCAYKSHGYTFFDDHIYYPDRLVELNRGDQLISAVAVTADGMFMGHAALAYPYPGARIAELTFIFVNGEYRGQGCMERLIDFLSQCPKKHPLEGIYTYAVTNHDFTQRGMARFGFQDCGLLLASSPETWLFKGIAAENTLRISVAASFRYLAFPRPLTLYVPSHHREMVKNIYRRLGAAGHTFFSPGPSETKRPEGIARIETHVLATESCAEIHILGYGETVFREVKKIVRELCLKHIAAIQLFLPLEDPLTCHAAGDFESMGFFFAGVCPMATIGDSLILQYLNNVIVDYDSLVLFSPMARDIRDYVRARDPYGSI